MRFVTTFLSLALLLLSFSLSAQTRTERRTMSAGAYEATVVDIPNLDTKIVGRLWTNYTKDFYNKRSKLDRKTKEYMAEGVDVANIGTDLNLHANVMDAGTGSQIALWVDLGNQNFVSAESHGDKQVQMDKMLMQFTLECAKEKIRLDIAAQEKDLKALQGDLKKLEREKENFERDIEKAQETIKQAEVGIETNATQQEDKQAQIQAQQDLIEETKKKLKDI